MEHPTSQPADAGVRQTRSAARAVVHDRYGHTVVAHYGSVPGELAVCVTSVGLAEHSDYGVLELRGAGDLLDRALVSRVGDPPPVVGSARRRHGVWYLRVEPRRTLLVGPYAALAAAPTSSCERDPARPTRRDVSASLAIVGIVGPRAARLLTAAGLPGALPIGAVGADAGDAHVVAVLRETQRRYLALVRADAAEAFWARLLTAGRPLGAAFVGHDALALLNASSLATA